MYYYGLIVPSDRGGFKLILCTDEFDPTNALFFRWRRTYGRWSYSDISEFLHDGKKNPEVMQEEGATHADTYVEIYSDPKHAILACFVD